MSRVWEYTGVRDGWLVVYSLFSARKDGIVLNAPVRQRSILTRDIQHGEVSFFKLIRHLPLVSSLVLTVRSK